MAKKKEKPEQGSGLKAALDAIDKKHGKGAVITGTTQFPEIERISSGSTSLDKVLNGGWAKGRLVEVYGPPSAGKTTIALHVIAECQAQGGICAFVDAEHALDMEYAQALGVVKEDLLVSQPNCGEDALDIVELLVRSREVDLIVVDSVAALTPRAELEGDMGDSHMGLHARMMSQATRKLAGTIAKSGTCVLFTNQIRNKIGVYFGSPEVTTGGEALKFYASQIVRVSRTGSQKDGDAITANTTRAVVKKNKVGPPYGVAEFDIIFGKGIDKEKDLLNFAVSKGVVEKSGASHSFQGEKIGYGAANTATLLRENPGLAEKIRDAALEKS
jgi:recombination protein RecA